MQHKFRGGVHPADHKAATCGKATVPMEHPPEAVVIPMSMHVGAPCAPTVAVGELVFVGQKVGEPTGLGAPVHASVSGRVTAVEPRPHVSGAKVMSVVIENDKQNTPSYPPMWKTAEKRDDPTSLTPADIVGITKEAGITGMGGATFPTHVKLGGAIGKVDELIINGAECEPYITADHRLMLERPEAVLGGTRVLMYALGLKKATIGIEGNKPDAVAALQALLPLRDGDIQVLTMRVRYPQGSEKQLIQRVTGRQVPPGKLPGDVGCAVFNVATAVAVYDAVYDGKCVTHRIITVTGMINHPKNLLVPIGTPIEDLVLECGGFPQAPERVLTGGPMMGTAQHDLTAPVTKGTNAILALSSKESAHPAESPTCIRCGKCVDHCPMNLTPLYMRMNFKKGNWDEVESLHVMDCIECGCCNFICPARVPLVQSFRTAKAEIRARQAKQRAAAAASAAKEGKA